MAVKKAKKAAKVEAPRYTTNIDPYDTYETMEEAASEAETNDDFDYSEEIVLYEVRKVGVARKSGITIVKS